MTLMTTEKPQIAPARRPPKDCGRPPGIGEIALRPGKSLQARFQRRDRVEFLFPQWEQFHFPGPGCRPVHARPPSANRSATVRATLVANVERRGSFRVNAQALARRAAPSAATAAAAGIARDRR